MLSTFLNVDEAATELALTPGRIRQLLRAGTLRGRKFSDRAWMIPQREVSRFRKNPPKTGRPRNGKKSFRKSA